MTARWHFPDPGVVAAVKATEPCPKCRGRGERPIQGYEEGHESRWISDTAPTPDGWARMGGTKGYGYGPPDRLIYRLGPCPDCTCHGTLPTVGWLTLPWPVQPGDELRMVEEQCSMDGVGPWRLCRDPEWHDETDGFERRQAHFATVTAGEVVRLHHVATGGDDVRMSSPTGWRTAKLGPFDWSPGRWAVRVASVVLHDPPRTTMPCPVEWTGREGEPRWKRHGHCSTCGGSGSVPLSVTDGEEAS